MSLRGREFVIPPLDLESFEKHYEAIKKLEDKDIDLLERLRLQAEIVHTALSTNYPDLRLGELRKKYLDAANTTAAYLATMGITLKGMPTAAPGEPPAP